MIDMDFKAYREEILRRWDEAENAFQTLSQEDRVYTCQEILAQAECLKKLDAAKMEWMQMLNYRSNLYH